MALERELKFLDADLDKARADLARLGGQCHGAVFEENLVFDTPERGLRSADVLLRLRSAGAATLTLKRHPKEREQAHEAKVWEEFESEVGDFEAVRAVLESLGYFVALRYEKVRETWTLHGAEICLDHLPFGDFMEIEGEEEAIRRCVRDLGLDMAASSKETYHALNAAYRKANGLPPDENFVFPAGDPRP